MANQYIDPNDPNMDSQATVDQSDPATQARNTMGLNSMVKGDSVAQAWLAAHHNGQNLSPAEQQQFAQLMGTRYKVDPKYISVSPNGQLSVAAAPNSFWKDLAVGSAITLGPIAATYLPGLFGASAAANGTGYDTIGDAWAAGNAATAGATSGIGAAATVATAAGASSSVPNWLTGNVVGAGIGAAGNIIGATIQSAAQANATAAQVKAATDALNFEKQKYGTVLGNAEGYVSTGLSANDRMAQLLGLPSGQRGRTGPSGPTFTDASYPAGGFPGTDGGINGSNFTRDQLAQMAAKGGIAPGSPNDKLLKQYGIPNPLDGTNWQGSGAPATAPGSPLTGAGGNQYGQSVSGGTPMSQVTLKAPDGSTKTFAPNDPLLAHYRQIPGVSVVNG